MTTVFPESFTAHVKILQHHIDQGKCKDPFRCVAALAIMEAFPQASYVSVRRTYAVVILAGRQYQTIFSRGMVGLIYRFDDDQPVEPAEFDLTFDLRP